MYRVEPFEVEHYYTARLIGADRDLCDHPASSQFAEAWTRGPGWTIFHNGKVVLMGGTTPYWPGVGEAWLLVTEQTQDHVHYCIKFVLRALKALFTHHGFNRVQASVHVDYDKAIRLVEWLGMKPEGLMPYYGVEGDTFIRYAITKEDLPWHQPQ